MYAAGTRETEWGCGKWEKIEGRNGHGRQIEGIKSNHAHIYADDEQNGCVNRKNVTARELQVCALDCRVCNEGGGVHGAGGTVSLGGPDVFVTYTSGSEETEGCRERDGRQRTAKEGVGGERGARRTRHSRREGCAYTGSFAVEISRARTCSAPHAGDAIRNVNSYFEGNPFLGAGQDRRMEFYGALSSTLAHLPLR